MKTYLSALMLAGLVFIVCSGASAQQKISMKRAIAIASKKAPGLKLKAKELEKEHGKWIYSFEFKEKRGAIREVNVDAYTGKVIGVEHESRKQREKEANEEKNEKKTKN